MITAIVLWLGLQLPVGVAVGNYLKGRSSSLYPGGEDAMIRGEYGFVPRFPRPAEPPPIGKLIERFKRLRAEE
jgi:hypothetical protein